MIQKKSKSFIKRLDSVHKLLICLAIGIAASFLTKVGNNGSLIMIMIGWDAFGILYLALEWATFSTTKSREIRSQASRQDPKQAIVFFMVLIASVFSVFAIIVMIVTKHEGHSETNWRIPVAISGLVLSWFLIHTLYALRYAHIFYGNDVDNPTNHAGGLEFPGDKKPDYLDFAYFSFTLGMTFQVSDVQITSKHIRRQAMFHGMISFAYVTVMIAMVINVTV